MIKNNKGVTLVELLIVIVVMGIIAAFAIPAVGTIIDNTQKDAIHADAIAVENAANLFCAQTSCASNETLMWSEVDDYVEGISITYYDFDDTGTGDIVVATKTTNGWRVQLNGITTGDYDWMSAGDLSIPSLNNREQVTVAD